MHKTWDAPSFFRMPLDSAENRATRRFGDIEGNPRDRRRTIDSLSPRSANPGETVHVREGDECIACNIVLT